MLDVAIVGGGVSGIYSAWRLMHCDANTSEILINWASYHPDGKLKIVRVRAKLTRWRAFIREEGRGKPLFPTASQQFLVGERRNAA